MSRDNFNLVSKFLHLNNEELSNKADKLYKVRPFTSRLIRNWQKYYKCSRDITIDEKMIRFDGYLKWKQFDPSKPVRHGIKSYLLCEVLSGYTYNEEIYCGKVQGENSKNSIEQIVNKLLDVFQIKDIDFLWIIFSLHHKFDRWYRRIRYLDKKWPSKNKKTISYN